MSRTSSQASVTVLDNARRVAAVLPDLRRRILESLSHPDSATGVARRLGYDPRVANGQARLTSDLAHDLRADEQNAGGDEHLDG